MRYGNSSIIDQKTIEAMGNDWKRVLAGMAFSSLCRHPEWDGQAVHFRFTPITLDEESTGIEIVSHFETDKENEMPVPEGVITSTDTMSGVAPKEENDQDQEATATDPSSDTEDSSGQDTEDK
jgi:hypothetical protein